MPKLSKNYASKSLTFTVIFVRVMMVHASFSHSSTDFDHKCKLIATLVGISKLINCVGDQRFEHSELQECSKVEISHSFMPYFYSKSIPVYIATQYYCIIMCSCL